MCAHVNVHVHEMVYVLMCLVFGVWCLVFGVENKLSVNISVS